MTIPLVTFTSCICPEDEVSYNNKVTSLSHYCKATLTAGHQQVTDFQTHAYTWTGSFKEIFASSHLKIHVATHLYRHRHRNACRKIETVVANVCFYILH
jgi:hypothetical protein